MSRTALAGLLVVSLAAASGRAEASAVGGRPDPHVDLSVVSGGCLACHKGHGTPRSPMLPQAQVPVCLSCHGTNADLERRVRKGDVSPDARPPLLAHMLGQPFLHRLNQRVFSADEMKGDKRTVTCSSCHSPHRGMRDRWTGDTPPGRQLLSTKDPTQFEYQLCESCHGSEGPGTQSYSDISRLLHVGNPSYHPVEAPSRDGSSSVLPALAGREINCTDCHGSADPRGPRGLHGSSEAFLLRRRYPTLDGAVEAGETYALCYGCHRRDRVLDSSPFPLHRLHVVEARASCATCHNPHGSLQNRALIRFSEEGKVSGVSPSLAAGRLGFLSESRGSGACYLTCHGKDHSPAVYGKAPVGTPKPFARPLQPTSLGRP